MKFILTTENKQLHSSRRLLEEATLKGLETKWCHPYETSIFFDSYEEEKDLEDTFTLHRTTGIRFDEFDINVAISQEQRGAKVFNPISTIMNFRDKALQHQFFLKHKLQSIPTYAFRGRPSEINLDDGISFINKHSVDDKFVLKTIRGNKGIGVNLINGEDSLRSILETFWAIGDQRFILQPFVKGEEYRLLIVGGKVTGIVHKESLGDEFRKNAGRGTGSFLKENEVPPEVIELGLRSFEHSKALYAGVDILYNENGAGLFEFNLVPGFEFMESVSGINQAREIISSAISKMKG
ncbi:MAG: hypothetical protein KAG61_05825 [Bacteriovoracaceae bacterium]|nr:hypothetical protein [Bacteriovoracaceae bacterium]